MNVVPKKDTDTTKITTKKDWPTIKNSLTDKNIESKKSMDMKDSVRAKISDEEKTLAVPDAEPYD
jgi:hypothetical protein